MMCQLGIRVQQQYYLESQGSRGWPSKETALLFQWVVETFVRNPTAKTY